MKCLKMLEIEVEIMGEKGAAPEGTWVLEDGIKIPATFYVYRARTHRLHVRKVTKNSDDKQG